MHTYDPSRANTRARTHTGTFTQHTMYVDIWIYASFHPVYRQYNLIQYNIIRYLHPAHTGTYIHIVLSTYLLKPTVHSAPTVPRYLRTSVHLCTFVHTCMVSHAGIHEGIHAFLAFQHTCTTARDICMTWLHVFNVRKRDFFEFQIHILFIYALSADSCYEC